MRVLKIKFEEGIVEKEKRGTVDAPDEIQKLVKDKVEWVDVPIEGIDKTHENIYNSAKEQDKIVAVGGDHSISYPLVKAFLEKYPRGGLIVFDAHLDCMDNFNPPTHEDWLRTLVEQKDFHKIFAIGLRHTEEVEKEFAKDKIIQGSIEDLKKFADKFDDIYISIDIDAFDPKFAPGTGWPEKDGLDPKDIVPVLKELFDSGKVKGLDIVEINPAKDIDFRTIQLGGKLLIDFVNRA